MRIAMIGQKRIPSREGGVEIHVEEIAVRLAAQGHDVTIYNRRRKGFPLLREYKGIKIVNIPTVDRKSLDAVIYSFLATIHTLFQHYDVIHYHAEGPCSMLWIPHLFGIRTVATIHGLDWQRAKWGGFATWFLLHGEKTVAKYADEIIVLSKNVQKYFLEAYGRETRFIPNGVNAPIIRKADIIKEKYRIDKDGYILFLARIVPEKGLHYLLEAFSAIKTNKKLVVAGTSSQSQDYFSRIQAMARNDSRVIMTGFVEGAELDELYSNAFLYVLPSDIEGMPISLLEAMSYGCQCLVSDIPENTEIIGDCGYMFHKGNYSSLKEQIISLLQDNSLAAMGGKAQVKALTQYNWNSIVTTMLGKCYVGKHQN
jgi:glycosyltransferase involved in cell wall biosynthesis